MNNLEYIKKQFENSKATKSGIATIFKASYVSQLKRWEQAVKAVGGEKWGIRRHKNNMGRGEPYFFTWEGFVPDSNGLDLQI